MIGCIKALDWLPGCGWKWCGTHYRVETVVRELSGPAGSYARSTST